MKFDYAFLHERLSPIHDNGFNLGMKVPSPIMTTSWNGMIAQRPALGPAANRILDKVRT